MIPKKQCRKCGAWLDAEAFFRRNKRRSYAYARSVCIGCEQTARDERKARNRPMQKAGDTIRRHSRDLGLDLARDFGWFKDKIAEQMAKAIETMCPYCLKPPHIAYPNGLSSLTVDIVTPGDPPYWSVNTKLCCQTCNQEKKRTKPHLWARKLLAWREWRENQDQDLPLFRWNKKKR